jgi:hypothetical protein
VELERQELTPELIEWAMRLCNDRTVYPDKVEQIVDIGYAPRVAVVIAIDEGNPPIVPLKQVAFKFIYKDDSETALESFEIRLLNPEEVDGGESRPSQFAQFLPSSLWDDLQDPNFWEGE